MSNPVSTQEPFDITMEEVCAEEQLEHMTQAIRRHIRRELLKGRKYDNASEVIEDFFTQERERWIASAWQMVQDILGQEYSGV